MLRRRLLPLLALALTGAAFAAPATVQAAGDLDVNMDIGRDGDRFVVKGPVVL